MQNKLIVAYARLSQEDSSKEKEFSTSIYNQLSLIKSYAKSMGLKIDKEYIDDGFSGTNFERPAFEQLRSDIDSGLVGTVVTKDLSRLGRNFMETAYYISEYFYSNNVRYIAINDQFDSYSSNIEEDNIMLRIRSLINDRCVKEVSVKRKQIAESKTNEGQFIGFMAPYGYKIKKIKDKRTLEIDEYPANIVKRIFSEVASGKSRKDVAEGLNKDKIIPPVIYMNMTLSREKKYYKDWTDKIVYRILKNQTYTGRIVKRKSIKRDYHQKKRESIYIRNRETIENCHPAIISDELFESANSKLRFTQSREKNNYSGLFSDLVICGECGRIMPACRIKKENGNVKYHFECTNVIDRKKCPNRTLADSKLRVIVSDTLRNIIDSYVDESTIVHETIKDSLKKERPNLKISNLKNDIEFHNKIIRDLYLKKTAGEIDLEKFIELKEKEMQLKEQSENMLKAMLESKGEELRKEELLKKYNQYINNGEFINDVVRELIDKVIIYKDSTIMISFKFGLGEPKKIKLF